MDDKLREKGVSEWKELVDGPLLGLAIGLLGGAIAAVAPNASLPWIFELAWVVLSIHFVWHLFRTRRWTTRVIANCILIPLIAVGLFALKKHLPTFREPPTANEIAEAVKEKMSKTEDINTQQTVIAQATPQEKSEPKTKKRLPNKPVTKPGAGAPPSATPASSQPPPIQAHLTISQSREISTRQDAPTATKVIVQTDRVFSSLKLVLQCDGPLVDGSATVGTSGMVQMMVGFGVVKDHPNIFAYSYGSSVPPFGPANPLIVTLWSKDPITCNQAAAF